MDASNRPTAPRNRIVVLAAPSGAGKTTIARRVLETVPGIRFSVSATTRPPRSYERDGVDYHFVSVEEFRQLIDSGLLLEWEEVYPGRFYGTPLNEVSRAREEGVGLLFDVDVKGAVHIKEMFGEEALLLFVAPPSVEALAQRLRERGTETEATLQTRLERVREELTYADRFDHVIVNEHLEDAVSETLHLVRTFLRA